MLVRAAVGGALVLASVAVVLSMQDRGTAPDVAFEDLAPEVQAEFERAVSEGQTALTFGDAAINDALEYFSRAYELHPNNERAVLGLEAVADRFLASVRGADSDTQFGVFGCPVLQHLPEPLFASRHRLQRRAGTREMCIDRRTLPSDAGRLTERT